MDTLEFGFFFLLLFWEAILVSNERQIVHIKIGDGCKIKGRGEFLPKLLRPLPARDEHP